VGDHVLFTASCWGLLSGYGPYGRHPVVVERWFRLRTRCVCLPRKD
jgi:hypothetical protein